MRGILAGILGALACATTVVAQPERHAVDVPPRTPLYCDDGGQTMQPFIYGDFGDVVAAYHRLEHMPGQVFTNGRFGDGQDMYVLIFERAADDPRSPSETVGYAMVRHADGYALRSAYDAPKDLAPQRTAGAEMCLFVMQMMIRSDPDRAAAFRKAWGEKHRDSTRP